MPSRDALSRWTYNGSATLQYSNHVYSFSLQEGFFLSNFGTADNVSTTYVTRAISSGLSIVQPKYWSVISPGLTMSPSVVRYVAPKVPTVLASRESVDLPGYDLWLHFVSFTQSLGSPSQSS